MSSSSEGSSGPHTPFDVPVVGEYVDMFLDELPRLPPPWEVEFNIELVPREVLVSKASYQLSPMKLKELKKQLEELLECGFFTLGCASVVYEEEGW